MIFHSLIIFLFTQCGLTDNCVRDETVRFINSFTTLLSTSNADINDFIKITHATNSSRPANGKSLIPASEIVGLKALIFELEDRSRCCALPVLDTLQYLDAVQLNYMCVQ